MTHDTTTSAEALVPVNEADALYDSMSLGMMMMIAGRQMNEALNSVISHPGVSADQLTVLGMVERAPGHPQNYYAGILTINDATFGRYVTRLIAEKLLRRRRSSSDRRNVHLYPTETGATLVREMRVKLHPVNMQMTTQLPDGMTDAMARNLRVFVASMAKCPPNSARNRVEIDTSPRA
ncbi:MAG: hypothetical protein AB8B51_16710 [Sedimentitalea sp.]